MGISSTAIPIEALELKDAYIAEKYLYLEFKNIEKTTTLYLRYPWRYVYRIPSR